MKTKESVIPFVLPFVLVGLVIVVWDVSLQQWHPEVTNELTQQWAIKADVGQAFGALSGFFAAFAFGAALYTIVLQRRQLVLQREEVEKSHDQLRKTAEAQERSVNALQQQAELLAVSARLNGLSALLDADIKIKDLKLAEHASRGATGRVILDFQYIDTLYNELAEELQKLSAKGGSQPSAPADSPPN